MSIMPPYRPDLPKLLWGYAASVEQTAELLGKASGVCAKHSARVTSGVLRSGLRGLHYLMNDSPASRVTGQRYRQDAPNTHSFLVHFFLKARQMPDSPESWKKCFSEVSHHLSSLDDLIAGKSVPLARRVTLRIFMAELVDWLVPEVRRQVAE